MTNLSYRRLNPSNAADLSAFLQVFRGTPSYTYATGGRKPTEAEVEKMMNTAPPGHKSDDIFIYAISSDNELCGCAFVVRGYPKVETAYLVLLMFIERAQGKSLGPQALRHIESEAASWGCSSLAAVVDSTNHRALAFWLREGFTESSRRAAPGFIGQAIAIEKHGL